MTPDELAVLRQLAEMLALYCALPDERTTEATEMRGLIRAAAVLIAARVGYRAASETGATLPLHL